MSQPIIDFLRVSQPKTIIFYSTLRAEPFFQWLMSTPSKRYSFPLISHWAYMDSAMILATNSVISPREIPSHRGIYPKWVSDHIYPLGYHWHLTSDVSLSFWPVCPSSGVVIQHLHIGPPLGGNIWFYVEHGEHFSILKFVLIRIILGCILYTQFY